MFDIDFLAGQPTPLYLYDVTLLRKTIETALASRPSPDFKIHYAIKANSNPELLRIIASYGLGADCVSLGEIRLALDAGFTAESIVMAGVGKSDEEIEFAIARDIECLNVESHEELQLIGEIAANMGREARVALRVNPDIDAHTHSYITTGVEEAKFGIDRRMIDRSVNYCVAHPWIKLVGLHFHIGSQILSMEPYRILCERVNHLVEHYRSQGIEFESINLGGGLGVDYDAPDLNPIPDFEGYFRTIGDAIKLRPGQKCLCEHGRAIVAQCGSLISRVRYVKEGIGRKFVILDAGMNDLIRPALYQAHHLVQNLTSQSAQTEVYDIVGPVCESDDCFGRDEILPVTYRGDIVAIRTAGAYGETMASCYNTRPLPGRICR